MVMVSLGWTGNVAAPQQGIFTHIQKRKKGKLISKGEIHLPSTIIAFSDLTQLFSFFFPLLLTAPGTPASRRKWV
jgi:hypothetical protein